jgi:hypothetical protein
MVRVRNGRTFTGLFFASQLKEGEEFAISLAYAVEVVSSSALFAYDAWKTSTYLIYSCEIQSPDDIRKKILDSNDVIPGCNLILMFHDVLDFKVIGPIDFMKSRAATLTPLKQSSSGSNSNSPTRNGKTNTAVSDMDIDAKISETTGTSHLNGRELVKATSWLTDDTYDATDLSSLISSTHNENVPGNSSSGKGTHSARTSSSSNATPSSHGGKWDQFTANQRLYNVTSSFDENLYTTKLDKSRLTKQQIDKADKLAQQIETEMATNMHIMEERGMLGLHTEDDVCEEDMYSGVLRHPVDRPTAVGSSSLRSDHPHKTMERTTATPVPSTSADTESAQTASSTKRKKNKKSKASTTTSGTSDNTAPPSIDALSGQSIRDAAQDTAATQVPAADLSSKIREFPVILHEDNVNKTLAPDVSSSGSVTSVPSVESKLVSTSPSASGSGSKKLNPNARPFVFKSPASVELHHDEHAPAHPSVKIRHKDGVNIVECEVIGAEPVRTRSDSTNSAASALTAGSSADDAISEITVEMPQSSAAHLHGYASGGAPFTHPVPADGSIPVFGYPGIPGQQQSQAVMMMPGLPYPGMVPVGYPLAQYPPAVMMMPGVPVGMPVQVQSPSVPSSSPTSNRSHHVAVNHPSASPSHAVSPTAATGAPALPMHTNPYAHPLGPYTNYLQNMYQQAQATLPTQGNSLNGAAVSAYLHTHQMQHMQQMQQHQHSLLQQQYHQSMTQAAHRPSHSDDSAGRSSSSRDRPAAAQSLTPLVTSPTSSVQHSPTASVTHSLSSAEQVMMHPSHLPPQFAQYVPSMLMQSPHGAHMHHPGGAMIMYAAPQGSVIPMMPPPAQFMQPQMNHQQYYFAHNEPFAQQQQQQHQWHETHHLHQHHHPAPPMVPDVRHLDVPHTAAPPAAHTASSQQPLSPAQLLASSQDQSASEPTLSSTSSTQQSTTEDSGSIQTTPASKTRHSR